MGCGQQTLAGFNTASGAFDTDAQAFFTAASITDSTQKTAVNQLVLDLKSASIWTKMTALYPFVGGAATPHSFNLKNTATFQITWNGTVTHNANGITPNGTTGFGNTGITPSTDMTLNDAHMSVYSRTSSAVATAEMGAAVSSTQQCELWCKYSDNNMYGELWKTGAATDEIAATVTNSQGLFTVTRRSSTDMETYRNATTVGNSSGTGAGARPNIVIYIGAINGSGSISSASVRNLALASIGTGLTDADVSAYYTAVQAYQTTLGRQV